MGLPNDNQKNVEWTSSCLAGLLNGDMDFELMSADVRLDLEATDEEEEASTKKNRTELVPQLTRLFEMTPHVFAIGGDNARVPVASAKKMEKDFGTPAFGCCAHAFSRCFQHICELEGIRGNIIRKMETVIDLFLTRTVFRELLRTQSKKSVSRIAETRFLSAFQACEKLIARKDDLEVVVDTIKFAKFRQESAPAVRQQCQAVKDIVADEVFWSCLEFFRHLCLGFVVAVRCLDGAKAGSVCLVYKFWSMLPGTIASAFIAARGTKCQSICTAELYREIKRVVSADWLKFHFPVYSAAFVLCPQFTQDVDLLRQKWPAVFVRLRDDTMHCIVQYLRRFDTSGEPRQEALAMGCAELVDLKQACERELDDYIFKSKHFGDMMQPSDLSCSPSRWWEKVFYDESVLRYPGKAITSLSPSTTPVERLHKVTKANRTKARNCLGYARALGLNFICCEELMKGAPADPEVAWMSLEHYRDKFTGLSSDDVAYLKQQEEREAQAAATEATIQNEELLATMDSVTDDLIVLQTQVQQQPTDEGGGLESEQLAVDETIDDVVDPAIESELARY